MATGGGRLLWSRQPGTSDGDGATGVATDTDGNAYVAGNTFGALGGRKKGDFDPWVIKFDGDGRRLWSRQPGTSGSDLANGVATDKDGNVFVVGQTSGALGGSNEGSTDPWVIEFDGDGHRLWSRQPGTNGGDNPHGVATDTDGNVYLVGDTFGPERFDLWVIKFDGDGHRLWTRQPGTNGDDRAWSVATDEDGNVYVVGVTSGALGGGNKGLNDAWVIKFDGDGHRLWSRQPGTKGDDSAFGVAIDNDENVFVVGTTLGALGGPNKGSTDAWVIKYAR